MAFWNDREIVKNIERARRDLLKNGITLNKKQVIKLSLEFTIQNSRQIKDFLRMKPKF